MSEYHLRTYLTPELARRGYRLALLSVALLTAGGAVGWTRAETIAARVRAEAARFRQLVTAPPATPHPASRPWDRVGGAALLLVSAAVAIRALVAFPVRGDEAAMYDSVASSWVPLWLVAGISTNNHPGYSALVWAGHFLWGDGVTGMRLFSLVFWGLSVVVAGRLHAGLVGRRSLALVALAFALPPVLTQGILARGHILTVCLGLLAALVAARSEGTGDAVRAGSWPVSPCG
ncbi:MAG TPA: hypothetical protein VM778_12250 [Gemmatimonadota bacterium]|nr:hypothetical protein [Gemmatimonadota bacterium]